MCRLTVLCENSVIACPGLLGEHGFCVLIEAADSCFLFDTGQGYTLIQNAKVLQKDLKKVSRVFLSHGHFDHTGGLEALVRLCGQMDVYAHPDVFVKRFAPLKNSKTAAVRPVGIPVDQESLTALGARFHFNTGFTEVEENMYLTGEVPRQTGFEKADKRLTVMENGERVQDPFRDDQTLVIRTAKGLAVVLGCAHSGMINTLNHIRAKLPGEKFHMVIGGTHMGFLDPAQVEMTIDALQEFSFEKIGVSHCTGLAAAARLKQAFGERFFFASAGTVINIE